MRRALVGVLSTSALLAGLTVGAAGQASADVADISHMAKGETLWGGEYIARWVSNNGNDYLDSFEMQYDGNLVLYRIGPYGWKQPCWATGTNGSGATHVTYQSDGNLVLYTNSGRAVWASDSQWGAGSTVDINWRGIVYVGVKPITGTCN
ncbi:hypothetical protein GCM10009839_90400 [Catenulispora yoronensis]|uniref:Bulb-type lectin domain-containing protein n=1 Tax=Catenulispora yoronensis TaxID=450799 RepID=A0ABN2VKR9_9ACTN